MSQSLDRDYSRKWGLRRFRMRTKLLLSIGILGVGYLLFVGLVQWTSATMQQHLRTASQSLFPAARAAQEAQAGFLKLNKDYKDAVVMQDSSALPLADLDAQKVASELSAFRNGTLQNGDLQSQAAHLQEDFAAFSQNSRSAYTRMLGTPASVNADLMLRIRTLAADNDRIAAALAKLDDDVSKKYFQAELNTVGRTIDRQRYLTCILFLVVFTFATFTSRILEREISVPLGRAVEALNSIAAGDLTVVLRVQGQDEVGLMGTALNRAIARVRTTLQEVEGTASTAGEFSQALTVVAGTIAAGAKKQASSLQTTSATLERITATARQNAGNAREASRLASTSKTSSERGQEVVSKAIAAMEEIRTSSARISDILSDIDEIAFQTNLLAVNAAIEAARAGDEGRGFAVVATEVRALAQRSASAAREIKALIQDSLNKVEHGSAMVNLSGESLQSIFSSVRMVTDLVGEIALASEEQRTGIEQVNSSMTLVDQVTQSNRLQTEELSEKLTALSLQSETLMELIGIFTLGETDYPENDQEAARTEENLESIAEDPVAAWSEDSRGSVDGEASHQAKRPMRAVRHSALNDFSTTRWQVQQDSVALVSTGKGGVITRNQIIPATVDDDSFEEF